MSILQPTPMNFSSSFLSQVDNRRVITERVTTSKQVSNRPCLLLGCGVSYVEQNEYVSPTGYVDADSKWVNEGRTYDENVSSAASGECGASSWSSELELNVAANLLVSGVRFRALYSVAYISKVRLKYYDGSAWVAFYEGVYPNNAWITKNLTSLKSLSRISLSFYNISVDVSYAIVFEVDFITSKVFDVCLHDGFNSNAPCKQLIIQGITGNNSQLFYKPLVFNKGLYLDFAEDVGSITLRYLIL